MCIVYLYTIQTQQKIDTRRKIHTGSRVAAAHNEGCGGRVKPFSESRFCVRMCVCVSSILHQPHRVSWRAPFCHRYQREHFTYTCICSRYLLFFSVAPLQPANCHLAIHLVFPPLLAAPIRTRRRLSGYVPPPNRARLGSLFGRTKRHRRARPQRIAFHRRPTAIGRALLSPPQPRHPFGGSSRRCHTAVVYVVAPFVDVVTSPPLRGQRSSATTEKRAAADS